MGLIESQCPDLLESELLELEIAIEIFVEAALDNFQASNSTELGLHFIDAYQISVFVDILGQTSIEVTTLSEIITPFSNIHNCEINLELYNDLVQFESFDDETDQSCACENFLSWYENADDTESGVVDYWQLFQEQFLTISNEYYICSSASVSYTHLTLPTKA